MAQLDYDPSKLVKVTIDKVVPNTWNPKAEGTEEYLKIKDSIWRKGLRGAIVVREHQTTPDFYEIIDGQQRYTAAKELGYEDLYVYNEGVVEDKEAKELTIWYQEQVPFEHITEAYLVTQLVDEYGLENVELPYTEVEIGELKELAEFNFDMYNKGEGEGESGQENGEGVTFAVKLSAENHQLVTEALKKYSADYNISVAQALVDKVVATAE